MTECYRYILDESGQPVPCPDLIKWADWFEVLHHRIVRSTVLKVETLGNIRVSTIFLGLDHNFMGEGRPLLWETTVLCPPDGSDRTERFDDREKAIAYHAQLVVVMETVFGATIVPPKLPRARALEPRR